MQPARDIRTDNIVLMLGHCLRHWPKKRRSYSSSKTLVSMVYIKICQRCKTQIIAILPQRNSSPDSIHSTLYTVCPGHLDDQSPLRSAAFN